MERVWRLETLLFSFAAFLILSSSPWTFRVSNPPAYADGIFQHTIDAKIGDRSVKLFLRINPPVLTTETKQDAFLQLRLFDANTNVTIPHTTYRITVTKGNLNQEGNALLKDFFHAHNGLLTLKIQPQEGDLTIFGTREDFQQAWVADPAGTINIKGPLLLEGGLYHINVVIFGIDYDTNIFAPGQEPRFDSWLSVGDVFRENIEYQNQNYNATLISYYDKIDNFNFDQKTTTISWSMPFDWNASRIASTPIFVHEELKIPKTLAGVGDSLAFEATATGMPLSGSMLSVDPFSSETALTLHYLIDKGQILKMADEVADDSQDMTFTLALGGNATVHTTGEMVTDIGGIGISVIWSPSQLDADKESTVTLKFSDAFSSASLDSDVRYNLKILTVAGDEILSKPDLVAKAGTDTQMIDFPRNENYRIVVEVTGLMKEGQPLDQTRNGIARGIVVVPELPAGAILAVAGIFGVLLVLQRFMAKNRRPGSGLI